MEQPQQHEREQKSPPPPPPPPPPLPSQNGSAAQDEADKNDREKSRRLMSEALQREDEFLEYLMSLSATANDGTAAAPAAADSGSAQDSGVAEEEDPTPATGPVRSASASSQQPRTAGLDHLDNLCKLMEQLGDLKEQNTKLQRRVQYLEDLKRLQVMHKQLRGEEADAGHGQASARAAAAAAAATAVSAEEQGQGLQVDQGEGGVPLGARRLR
ncbi:homeobox protein Hox-A3-like [Schistocerca piceifrons]|uniref:homeobox protein Hox-A3-like n=1 Tax=Schistocerca piceifrons TaxID=274613 RepID=UPI001F5F0D79|nr:homeobox protein Hox-A3-like [Schistocerca piceifrons]XP_049947667.1 homeobox protein Hox-A3-like [Schistocerca serialis cubense]